MTFRTLHLTAMSAIRAGMDPSMAFASTPQFNNSKVLGMSGPDEDFLAGGGAHIADHVRLGSSGLFLNRPVANPWPNLSQRRITSQDLGSAFFSKGPMRTLLSGGPIAAPEKFWLFHYNEGDLQRANEGAERFFKLREKNGLLQDYDQPTAHVTSCDHAFSHQADWVDFAVVAKRIAAGEIDNPLVYKPNNNILGKGVFFIEQTDSDKFKVTLLNNAFDFHDVTEIFPDLNFHYDDNKKTFELVLTQGKDDIAAVLMRIRSFISVSRNRSYDSGIMETVLPLIQVEGHAFETRHFGTVDLTQISPDNYLPNHAGSFSKIGSSAVFSNRTASDDSKVTLFKDNMYGPLMQALDLNGAQSFSDHVDQMIALELEYIAKRLKAAGIVFTISEPIDCQFDLGWLPPLPGERFPRPAIIEAHIKLYAGFRGFRLVETPNP